MHAKLPPAKRFTTSLTLLGVNLAALKRVMTEGYQPDDTQAANLSFLVREMTGIVDQVITQRIMAGTPPLFAGVDPATENGPYGEG